jgi:hypothetical protein
MVWVRERTIPTERLPLVGEVTAKLKQIMSTAECDCDDGPQVEEHAFWDYKLYVDQRAAVLGTLAEKAPK